MTIRRKLVLIALIPLFLIFGFAVAQLVVSREVETATDRIIRADGFYKQFSDLTILTHEHYMFLELRAHEQWEATYRKLGEQIAAGRGLFTTPEERDLMLKVSNHYATVGYLFSQYGPHAQESSILRGSDERQHFLRRITTRLHQELQIVMPLLERLHHVNQSRVDSLTRQQERWTLVLLIAFGVCIPVTLWLLYRSFSQPLATLRAGIDIMAGGDLDHRINLPATDEMGQLGGAFDLMAEQRSRYERQLREANEGLEQRVRERTAELRQSEARYRSLFANSHTVMLLVNPETEDIEDANPAAERFYGYTLPELRRLGIRRINCLAPAEIRAEMELARSEKRFHFFFQHRLADGTVRDVEVFSGPIRVDDRELLFSIVHDVTEQRKAELALQEKTVELENFFSLALDLLCIADLNGFFVRLNRQWETVLGLPLHQLEGQSFLDFIHPDDLEATRAAMSELTSDSPVLNFINRYRYRDGSYRWIEWRAHPYDNRLIYAAARDITERRSMEMELKEQRDRLATVNLSLEEKVRERTALLEKAVQELEHMCYAIAHDLRAPLRHINAYSAMVDERQPGGLDAGAREALDRIGAMTVRMGALVDGLLKLPRLSRHELRKEPVDLSAMARDILAQLQVLEPTRMAELAIQEGVVVQGEPRLLRTAMDNLLGNSWKFSAGSSPTRIAFGREQWQGREVLYVRDNGAGFDMAYADKLFTIFERLHLEREFDGLGIGLATVQRIVAAHGGDIWPEGVPGEGAVFRFTLWPSQPASAAIE